MISCRTVSARFCKATRSTPTTTTIEHRREAMHLTRRGRIIVERMDDLRLGPLDRLARLSHIRPFRLRALAEGDAEQELDLQKLAAVLRIEVRELVMP